MGDAVAPVSAEGGGGWRPEAAAQPPASLTPALLLSFLLEVGRLDLVDTISLTPMPITNYYVSSDGMGNVTAIVDGVKQ